MNTLRVCIALASLLMSPGLWLQAQADRNTRQPGGEGVLPEQLQNPSGLKSASLQPASLPPSRFSDATGDVETAWVRMYQSQLALPARGSGSVVKVDSKGNVYVAGTGQDSVLIIVKYNSAGARIWTRQVPNVATVNYKILLALDKNDNVYVAGTAFGTGARDYAFLTIKYDSDGNTVWMRKYDEPGGLDDHATSLAVDHDGNVFVAGGSGDPNANSYDYAMIKYTLSGDIVWLRRYNGPVGGWDEAEALCVDDSGNVYVTGGSTSIDSTRLEGDPRQRRLDCTTIKYGPSGDTVWIASCHPPTRGNTKNTQNMPRGISVDRNGSAYVEIASCENSDFPAYNFLCLTVRYTPSGDTIWTRTRSGYPAALAIDKQGNVYVTGSDRYPYFNDYLTIKYSPAGDTVWTRTYDGPGNGQDAAQSLALDQAGNVCVTGASGSSGVSSGVVDYATVKYNSAGDTLWVRRYNNANTGDTPFSLALDANDNIYITGSTYLYSEPYPVSAILTIKYVSNGDTAWVRLHDESPLIPGNNIATAFDVDKNGIAYVTGVATTGIIAANHQPVSAAVTIKYNPGGDTGWVKTTMAPYSGAAQPGCFTADGTGNLYAATSALETGVASESYFTIKYNLAGDTLWAHPFRDSANWAGRAASLTLDENGNVYVTGSTYVWGASNDYATIKYNSAGDTLWARRYNGQSTVSDEATSVAVDHSGNVYVTGTSWYDSPEITSNYVTVKYNSRGDTLWTRRYHGPGNGYSQARIVALGTQGDVYVTGSTGIVEPGGTRVKADYTTVKYNSTGDVLWTRTYNAPFGGVDEPTYVAVDLAGNIFVTGYSQDVDSSYACTTIKYSPAGDTLWIRRYPQNGNAPPFLTVDAGGNAYVAVSSSGPDSAIATIKYGSNGTLDWVASYPAGRNCVGVRLDAANNVYVACTTPSNGTGYFTVIKYTQSLSAIGSSGTLAPLSYSLEQNYPNPFNPVTVIKYTVGGTGDAGRGASNTRLVVYDVLGREVKVLVNERKRPGRYEATFDGSGMSSGVYFYRMEAGNFVQTRKLLLLK